jgi:hypothetical protein
MGQEMASLQTGPYAVRETKDGDWTVITYPRGHLGLRKRHHFAGQQLRWPNSICVCPLVDIVKGLEQDIISSNKISTANTVQTSGRCLLFATGLSP